MKNIATINIFFLFLITLLFLQLTVFANDDDCKYELYNGKIKIFDYYLEPQYPIDESEDVVIVCDNSPDGRWTTIQSGYRIKVDIWLYDKYTKKSPVRIDTEPGNHTNVKFHGNKVFEVRWGGMGYLMSDFFLVDNPKFKIHIDDVLTYNEELDIYISFYDRGIDVGRVIAKANPEKFRVDFDLTSDYSAISPLFLIEEIELVADKLILKHRKENGQLATEYLKPILLGDNAKSFVLYRQTDDKVE